MTAERWGEYKFIPRGRSTFKNKERGGGRGVNITPARSHCYFATLCSPTNGVPDWELTHCQSFRCDILLLLEREEDG